MFGPDEWTPFTIRATISGFIGILFIPIIVKSFGGITLTSFLWYQGINYFIYYLLVLIFAREEIIWEIGVLPAVLFFDFALNIQLLGIFGDTISNMLTNGIESGWPFIIFAGIVLGLIFFSKNARKIGNYIRNIFKRKEDNVNDSQTINPEPEYYVDSYDNNYYNNFQ